MVDFAPWTFILDFKHKISKQINNSIVLQKRNSGVQHGVWLMRAGQKSNHQQIVNHLQSFYFNVLKKLCTSDETLSSQKKSYGLDAMLLSTLRQALTLAIMQKHHDYGL